MIKHTQTIRSLPTNCLTVFEHIMGLALKGLRCVFHSRTLSEMGFQFEDLIFPLLDHGLLDESDYFFLICHAPQAIDYLFSPLTF